MKKLTSVWATITSLLILPMQVLAATGDGNIGINKPAKGGFVTIGDFISNALSVAFAVAIVVVLIMLILGAFEWITSGGEKENVGKARNRIINALIGLAVLAIAYALARVAGQFLGFENLDQLHIPTPNPEAKGL